MLELNQLMQSDTTIRQHVYLSQPYIVRLYNQYMGIKKMVYLSFASLKHNSSV